jgi:ADP-ribose pyrophosphatase
LKWKILSSEYLFKERWFTVRKDKCLKPDGGIVDPYYVFEFPTWVTIFPLTEDNRVVMVKQYRHAVEKISIEIPGGCVDDEDENFQAAAERELLEETGYQFSHFEYLGKTSPNPSTNSNWMHMFLAKGGKKVAEQKLDLNEDIEVELLTIEEVKTLIKEHGIIQSMHVTCMLYALNKLGELTY